MQQGRSTGQLDRSCLLRFVLVIAIIVLLGNAAALSRDYQDSWVLEGLEPIFVVFMIIYSINFFYEKRETRIVALAITCCVVLCLIPNLKYVWFTGREIDQQGQYKLANEVYDSGYIATQFHGGHSEYYVHTPLIHLSFAIFSIILNIPMMFSMKILPVLLSTLYPLLTYSMMRNIKLSKRTSALKYALFISSIPVGAIYVVTGRTYGTLLIFLVLYQIVKLVQKNDRRHWFILLFFIFALATAHSASSLLLAILILAVASLQKVPFMKINQFLKNPTILATMTVTLGWLMFSANKALYSMVSILPQVLPVTTPESTYGSIPFRLFELMDKSIFAAAKSVIVYHGADFFLLLFTVVGLVFVFKTFRQSDDRVLKFLFLINVILILFLVLGVSLNVGQFFWSRITIVTRILYPIFSGIAILYVIRRKTLCAVIFLSIMLLATFQLYGCQPLIAPASTLSKDLPANEPVVYVVEVNSIYQRQMISFAEAYAHGLIAADRVTTGQIIGLTQYNFSRSATWYYPIARLVDKTLVQREYDYFLIHLPGKSGAFIEQAEMRTKELILDTIYNSSIFYTNGESYICGALNGNEKLR